jgi:ABC-2 type transport system ATP-binding protein
VLFSSHQLDLVEDLCEDVVIIDHGRIVRAGDLEELREAAPERRIAIRWRGPAPDWAALPAAELIRSSDGHAVLRVDPDVDLGAVVAAAGETTEIVSFSYQAPTLSELFRSAVVT